MFFLSEFYSLPKTLKIDFQSPTLFWRTDWRDQLLRLRARTYPPKKSLEALKILEMLGTHGGWWKIDSRTGRTFFSELRLQDISELNSETGGIRFRRARFQTPNSVSFLALTEFQEENSVSSSQPIICVAKRTHRVFRRTHRVCCRTQWVLSSETVLSKQYSARFLSTIYIYISIHPVR